MDIIIDRKRKRWTNDFSDKDPLGLDEAKKNKSNQIEVSDKEINPIDKFLCLWLSPHFLIGKKIYARKSDNSSILQGFIVDVYPSRHLLIKQSNGENIPIAFEHVITLEG